MEGCSFYVVEGGKSAQSRGLHEIKTDLQSPELRVKVATMEEMLRNYRSPASAESCLMHVIKFVSGYGAKDHELVKLNHLYWECLSEESTDSALVLLVSQIIRNELQSPNEYVRGACLKNLAKICNEEILKTVDEVIVQNLDNPHGYVRSNCCMCIGVLGEKFPLHHGMFEDAIPQLICMAKFDPERNVQQHAMRSVGKLDIMMAYKTLIEGDDDDHDGANFIMNKDVYNLSLIELIQMVWQKTKVFPPPVDLVSAVNKSVLTNKLISILENTASNAVRLSVITTLLWLSSDPEHLAKAAQAAVLVITTQSNADVKLHVMNILEKIREAQPDVIELVAIDILGTLSTFSMTELVSKAISLAVQHVTYSQARTAVDIFKTQLLSKKAKKDEQILYLRGMRQLCGRFPSVALCVIDLLLNFATSETQSEEIIALVRELVVCSAISSEERANIIKQLIESLGEQHEVDGSTMEQTIYLIGEFCHTAECRDYFVQHLYDALKPFPFPSTDVQPAPEQGGSQVMVKTVILPDGTYGTENIVVDEGQSAGLRRAVVAVDCANLYTIIAVALCKAILRDEGTLETTVIEEKPPVNRDTLHKAIVIVSSLFKLCQKHPNLGVRNSSVLKRLGKALNLLCDTVGERKRLSPVSALTKLVAGEREVTDIEEGGAGADDLGCSIEDEIKFFERHDGLSKFDPRTSSMTAEERFVLDDAYTTGIPLSGLSDPLYIEAFVKMNHLDVNVELMINNLLNETLTNVTVCIGTHGDLRILETPQSVVLEPYGKAKIQATVRLSSTEAGLIFGFCTFERNKSVDKEHFTLSELQVDLLDCLERSWIGHATFRKLWAKFEWENKIPTSVKVKTGAGVLDFLRLLLKQTKMTLVGIQGDHELLVSCLGTKATDEKYETYVEKITQHKSLRLMADNGIMALNFCTKSIFGEDALVNLSLQMQAGESAFEGNVRIRSRTQGIALSLGDRVAQTQRLFAAAH